jgi:transposase InsO family protein
MRRAKAIAARAQTSFEIACDNRERVRIAFALDCCDREAMSWVATTGGITGDLLRDLMVEAVESRFGNGGPGQTIEWLTDNGSPYIAKRHAHICARDRPGTADECHSKSAIERDGRSVCEDV